MDHSEYINSIDIIKEFIDYNELCDFANCLSIKREFRNENIYEFNNSKRYKLYNNAKLENGIIIQQMIE